MSSPPALTRRSIASRLLDPVEWLGNKLPDPLTLFIILAVAVPIISYFVAQSGWSVTHPNPEIKDPVRAVNLLTKENLRRMFTDAVKNFTSFPPLGLVLVAMLGIGVVERGGLITALLKSIVTAVPRRAVSGAVVFAGVMASMAADVGYVVLVPLGAVVFAGMGRHPLAGLAAAFAGVAAGFSANLFVTSLDPLLTGLTQSAIVAFDPNYKIDPTCNWYFMIASTFLLTGIGWFVTDKIVEPRLGQWNPVDADPSVAAAPGLEPLTRIEKIGLASAAGALVIVLGAVALLSLPEGALLRDANGSYKPLQDSIVPIMVIAFFVPGLVYGLVVGTIRDDKTVARMTAESMSTMGVYIVLAFAAAQFTEYFKWSNLGTMLAISGADWLKSMAFQGPKLLVAFILVAACINLFIGSASAKWSLMAPVFVPMFMGLGISPEMTQATYRVGDSCTNIITPLLPYFPIIIAFGRKYEKNLGIGTLSAAMLPYSIAFLIGWTALLMIWWALDAWLMARWGIHFPLGPGAPLTYPSP